MRTRFSQSLEMSRLTRDGTAEIVSRDQILRRERGQFIFPVQLTMCRMGNLTRLIHTLAICVTIYDVGEKPTVIPTVHYIYRHRCFSHSAYWSLFESLGFFVETSKSRPTHARLRNRELADEAELVSLSVG